MVAYTGPVIPQQSRHALACGPLQPGENRVLTHGGSVASCARDLHLRADYGLDRQEAVADESRDVVCYIVLY
jgi:hypothetical protein